MEQSRGVANYIIIAKHLSREQRHEANSIYTNDERLCSICYVAWSSGSPLSFQAPATFSTSSFNYSSFHFILHGFAPTPSIMYKDEERVKSRPCRELHQKIWNFFALPLVLNKVSIYVSDFNFTSSFSTLLWLLNSSFPSSFTGLVTHLSYTLFSFTVLYQFFFWCPLAWHFCPAKMSSLSPY